MLPGPWVTETPAPPTPTRIPSAPTKSVELLENEIAASIVDSMYDSYRMSYDYYSATPSPEYVSMDDLVIWSRAKQGVDPKYTLDYANPNFPIKVWLFVNGQMIDATNNPDAVKEYRKNHSEPRMYTQWGYPYTEFNIISISEDGQSAKLFFDSLCGSLCGMAYIRTYQRNASGQWEMRDEEIVGYH